jgi:hypothetical protein
MFCAKQLTAAFNGNVILRFLIGTEDNKRQKRRKINRNNAAVYLSLSNGRYDAVKTGERQVVAINSGPSDRKEEENKKKKGGRRRRRRRRPNPIHQLHSATTSHAHVLDVNAV